MFSRMMRRALIVIVIIVIYTTQFIHSQCCPLATWQWRAPLVGRVASPVPLVLPDLRYVTHQLTHLPPVLRTRAPVVPKTRGNTDPYY